MKVILGVNSGCIGAMEKTMESTIVYLGYIGLMEKMMEATFRV